MKGMFMPNMNLISREPLIEKFKNWIKDIEDRQDDNNWWAERDAVECCLAEVEGAPAIIIPHWVKFSERRPPKKEKEYLVAIGMGNEIEGSWYSLEIAYYAPIKSFAYYVYETEETIKRDYHGNDWAFGRYTKDIDFIGIEDDWVAYWFEGLKLPKGENNDS